MAVFIRKFQDGGVGQSQNNTSSANENADSGSQPSKFNIGNYSIDLNTFSNDLENNFQTFYNIYEGTWTNKEKKEIMREHDLFLKNLRAGNITGIDSAGRFSVLDPAYSGINFNSDSWGRYSYYVKKLADLERTEGINSAKTKKTFTNTSILRDIHNNFFGGTENPDYRSFFDLDEVVTTPDGRKVRGVRNRVNALLDLLNENYISQYTDADESLGGIEGVRARIDRLRTALADGTLNNEDYASAAALGLNLRGLLSTDGNLEFNDSGGFTSDETNNTTNGNQNESAESKLRELAFGKQETADSILNKITNWDSSIDIEYKIPIDPNFKATDYIRKRMRDRNEKENDVATYYRTEFFPKFFENLKTYTPEYLTNNGNATVQTWEGKQKISDYVRKNLTLAIRNKLYNKGSLLTEDISNDLNQIVGTNFWIVPKSLDEDTGTVLLFNPDTGAYKRVSINNRNLKFIPKFGGQPVNLLQAYLLYKGILSAKKGAKLQLGGAVNALDKTQGLTDDEKNAEFASLFGSDSTTTNDKSEETDSNDDTKKKHNSDVIIGGENPSDWETRDYARLVSLGADLVSLAGGYVGLGGGITSTISDIVGDVSDESLTSDDVVKNAAINTAWTVAGLVPGVKLGKVGKTLLKWGPRGVALLNGYGLIADQQTYKALERMFTTGEVTSDDLNLLTQIGRAITGGIGMGKAIKREHIYKKGQVEKIGKKIKVRQEGHNEDFDVELRNSELDEINSIGRSKGQKAANEKLQEILKNKGWKEESVKKTTLKEDIFGEGSGKFDKIKRVNKKIKGEDIYSEPSSKHLEYIHEKYGKWMGLENEGEGLIPSDGIKLGVKGKYNSLKDAVLGGNEYDRYVRSETPETTSKAGSNTPKTTNETGKNNTSTETPESTNKPGDNASKPGEGTGEGNNTPGNEVKPESNTGTPNPKEPQGGEPSKVNVGNESKTGNPEGKEKIDSEKKKNETKKQQGLNKLTEQQRKETKSSSAKQGTDTNARRINKDRKYYYDLAETLPSGKEKLELISYLNSFEGKKRNKGRSYGRFNSDKAEKIIKPLREKGVQLSLFKRGSKLRQIVEYKRGNILKAQPGTKVDWFEEYQRRYPLKQLGNIELKPRNQNADTSVLNRHNDDFTLRNAYTMNDYYIGENSNLVGKDIQSYIDNAETQNFNTLQDLVNQYNSDASLIRGTWDYGSDTVSHNHKANTQRGMSNHNRLFKRMFASRSQSNNNNSLYNIGYQDNIEDIMGTSTWMRRMDQYKSEFDPTKEYKNGLDEEGYLRIHKVKLRNGTEGYVYKKANGDIGILDSNAAERFLNQKPAAPQDDGDTPGNDFDWTSVGSGDSAIGTRKQVDLYKYLPATLAFGRMLGDINATNRRTRDYLGRLQVPLQSPWQFHRQVYGDYGSMMAGKEQAAQIRSQLNSPFTSNANLATLRSLEAERLANEQIQKGRAADNEMIHRTYELSAAEQKENAKRRTDVANVNRGLMAKDAELRAGIIAAADAANHNSLDAWLMNYVEKPIQEEAYKRKAYQEWYDYASMGPMEYDFTNDAYIQDAQRRLDSIPADDPNREKLRADILRDVQDYRAKKAASYRIGQLIKFRRMNPYIIQRVPFDDTGLYHTTGVKTPNYQKGGNINIYGSAVLKAKTKDNDRLIKQILEVIRNHKDLVRGMKTPDYSKYIIRDQR